MQVSQTQSLQLIVSKYCHKEVNVRQTRVQKIAYLGLSFIRELSYGYKNVLWRMADFKQEMHDIVGTKRHWKNESSGLYVFIHGLNGHPSIWRPQLGLLDDNTDTYVPYVPLKGNGPLEKIAKPILNDILKYIKAHPTKPISLCGVSNGGRICLWLETQLRTKAPRTPIRISTIAAVHFGTSRIDTFNKMGLTFLYDSAIMKELGLASGSAVKLMQDASKALPKNVVREFEFIASTEDLTVPEIYSSLPKLPSIKTDYVIVHGYGHNGIVEGVAQEQVKKISAWMKNKG